MPPIRFRHLPALFALSGALVLLLSACSGQSGGGSNADLPDFPKFEPADDFLRMQRRLKAFRPPGPQPYPYTERNELIYRQLQRRIRFSDSELAFRAEQQGNFSRVDRTSDIDGWNAYRERLARLEMESAIRERSARRSSRTRLDAGFQNFQQRVKSLRLEKQAEERIRELRRLELLQSSQLPGPDNEGSGENAAPAGGAGAAPSG